MTLIEQAKTVEYTRAFLNKWGLKQKYVAQTCLIPEKIFSRFLTGKLALSDNQLARVMEYINDYEQKNG